MIKVNSKSFKVVKEFAVYHCGWECDTTGWVVEDEGSLKLVLSSHGSTFFAEKKQIVQFIEEYSKAIVDMEGALEMIDNE